MLVNGRKHLQKEMKARVEVRGTYWLVVLRLCRGGGSGRSRCGGRRHRGGLDGGELMPGLSRSSLGLYRSGSSRSRSLPESPAEAVAKLLYGGLSRSKGEHSPTSTVSRQRYIVKIKAEGNAAEGAS